MLPADLTLLDVVLIAVAIGVAGAMLRRPVRDSPFWRATVTPLASIIGSGFLVVAPMLAAIAGAWAAACIVAIVALSFWIGSALRFNILHEHKGGTAHGDPVERVLERVSDIVLALAYVISITFYIRLMSGFVLTGIGAYAPVTADALASAVLAFIGLYGLLRGLHGLERLEEYSVTIKLAIIGSLLLGLVHFDVTRGYDLSALGAPGADAWETLRRLGGMLLIVQGFETSKYLGGKYPAPLRARSMLLAQALAGVIYVFFVVAALPLTAPYAHGSPDENAIIELSGRITAALPMMLVLAAAMSQFSAAVADTIGAGGVFANQFGTRVSARLGYPLVAAFATVLVWTSNIFGVIALASRAFALFYLLQALVAMRLARRIDDAASRRWRRGATAALAAVLLWVVVFAIPADA
ncbi:MAG: hypothetical protein R3E87_10175 [Burkholderiaceae bacterium]